MTTPPTPSPVPVSSTGQVIHTAETPAPAPTAPPPASLTPPKPRPLPKASPMKEALKVISLQFPSQLDDMLRLQREQVELTKELIQAIKQQPAAAKETKIDKDKPTPPVWSLDPVPASYDGLYATFSKDKETGEWMPIVPIWCLQNPLEIYEHEGRKWNIIPTISRTNEVGKVAIADDTKMSSAFVGKEWSRYPGEQVAFCYWWGNITCDKWTLPEKQPEPAPVPEPQTEEMTYEDPF